MKSRAPLYFPPFALVLSLVAADPRLPAPAVIEPTVYLIQTLDVLRIQVFQEQELSTEVRVAKDGGAIVPLLGTVQLAGLRTEEAANRIARLYEEQEFLVAPSVAVTVVGYNSQSVNVLGAVNSPGAVPLPPELRFHVLDAVTKAGGFSRIADLRKVRLVRRNAGGELAVLLLDLEKFMLGKNDQNIPIRSDDVIYVPERNF